MTFKVHPAAAYQNILHSGAQLVDVREADEVAAGSLPEAINIPLSEFADRFTELDSTCPVVLLCRSGARSGQAAGFLAANGFHDVTNLEGGMLAWADRD